MNTKSKFINEIILNNDIKLMHVNSSQYGAGLPRSLHSHAYIELFYCINGHTTFNIKNDQIKIGKDDCIILNSNVEHIQTDTSNNFEYIVLGVDSPQLSFLGDERPWVLMNFAHSKNKILPFLEEIVKEQENCIDNCETICSRFLDIIFLKVARENTTNNTRIDSITKECAQVKRYIDFHYREAITLDMLAELVNLNKYYLSHSFSNAYKCSPINYMLGLRLDESEFMLRSTNYSPSRISHILGFSSPSYFTQSFVKKFGMKPKEYRDKSK